jgi:hypothetical protein
VAGLRRTTTRETLGSASFRSWSCLARMPAVSCWDSPVTLPPGRARLTTSPASTGSAALTMTMEMVAVARLAASAGPWDEATITSTFCCTRSAASSGYRSGGPRPSDRQR